jgi:hypothetical protein
LKLKLNKSCFDEDGSQLGGDSIAVDEESKTGGWRNFIMRSLFMNSRRVECVPYSAQMRNNKHECFYFIVLNWILKK